MPDTHHYTKSLIEDTVRLEAFSDGVFAIVATLLVLELRVPALEIVSTRIFFHALVELIPEFLAFFFSFFVIAIYWVNHHHFFQSVKQSDWKLLWYNNFFLFWLTTVPFTTAFIGRYYQSVVPVALYALDMAMCALSIMLMIRYVFFRSRLMHPGFLESQKKTEYRRGMWGVYLYLGAAALALVYVYFALAILIAVPILYVVPRLLSTGIE